MNHFQGHFFYAWSHFNLYEGNTRNRKCNNFHYFYCEKCAALFLLYLYGISFEFVMFKICLILLVLVYSNSYYYVHRFALEDFPVAVCLEVIFVFICRKS